MKRVIPFLILLLLVGGGIYYAKENDLMKQLDKLDEKLGSEDLPDLSLEQEKKSVFALFDGDIYTFMDEKDEVLQEKFGKPDAKYPTPYGYTWWVYTDGKENYMQFGIEEGEVVTVFATGKNISADPFTVGDSYEEIKEQFSLEEKVTYQDGLSFYTFLLNEDDLAMHPLIKIDDDMFMQCYIDDFTKELSSIRLLKGDVLLAQRVYEMEYRGSLPEEPELTDKEWRDIEQGMEQQIFDLTNVIRNRFGLSALTYDEEVSKVALAHSKDMFDNQYFSHYAEDGTGLKERLAAGDVHYLSAGENIAAQYTDGPAAMEGWLNSEGHREALLFEEYTHLGIGVHRLYYTQNFLMKP